LLIEETVMAVSRRAALATLASAPALATAPALAAGSPAAPADAGPAYGLIVKMRAQPGQRDALIAILAEGTAAMPGCLSYVIAKDKADPDALWITEAWTSAASHKASRALPMVGAAIAKGRPLIAGIDQRFETEPVAGIKFAG
jgi:quinol monooxygenase YgiN